MPVTRYTQLQSAKSEEDVKDTSRHSSYAMFTQLLHGHPPWHEQKSVWT